MRCPVFCMDGPRMVYIGLSTLQSQKGWSTENGSTKVFPCYPGNAAAILSGSMKNIGCYMGNRLTAKPKK